ncbi:phosphotransacetylase [Sedimentibacter acidaminivorans]|uniref:Phosphotransacetylase n=1 Tax=Sedimentibacter acidaminivorans TaxID=913099 RepID=A0ABS4GDM7_9FIRM|nr:phosphate acyltransferase [Sedimentibacter acidaminivorans]MBP1925805.1 phosphotransacetylase [Sedimentibacter acidaminivorans]
MYKNFDELMNMLINSNGPIKRAVVAGAADEHALEAVFLAQEKGFVTPVLVGVQEDIINKLHKMNYLDKKYKIVNCENDINPSEIAVKLIHKGEGDFIIKGKLETKDLLKPILNKETGLNKNGFITHFGFMQLKGYHKLLSISDCAVIPYPTLEEKKKIIMSCTEALIKLGYNKPVVGALCAVETVSEKMPETVDALKLKEMSMKGLLGNCVVEGPISFDLATSSESAEIKGYKSPYAGDVDMLLVPQMVTGNVMSKIWNADPDNIMAGCLVGADIPIVLTSRSASMNEKLYSILLCTMLS